MFGWDIDTIANGLCPIFNFGQVDDFVSIFLGDTEFKQMMDYCHFELALDWMIEFVFDLAAKDVSIKGGI